jgi:hypothetical protein
MYNVIENPIPRSGLFATKTLGELQAYIELMSAEEKAQAYLIMQLTLNACYKIVEDEILSKEVFGQ